MMQQTSNKQLIAAAHLAAKYLPQASAQIMVELAVRLEARTEQQPVGWTDEVELRDVEKTGCGYLFKADPVSPNADPRRVIKLYRQPPDPAPVTVKQKQFTEFQICHYGGSEDYAKGYIDAQNNYNKTLSSMGIKIAEGE